MNPRVDAQGPGNPARARRPLLGPHQSQSGRRHQSGAHGIPGHQQLLGRSGVIVRRRFRRRRHLLPPAPRAAGAARGDDANERRAAVTCTVDSPSVGSAQARTRMR